MRDEDLEALEALVPALLRALEGLGLVARYLAPGEAAAMAASMGRPQDALRALMDGMAPWAPPLAEAQGALERAGRAVLAGFDELDAALETGGDMRGVYRALRRLPAAQEALYPLAAGLAPVSRFFLSPERRGDADLLRRLAEAPAGELTGVAHVGEPGERGGVSLYVPETYDPAVPAPLVMALHGGSGNGRAFLWSWLRDARAAGAILVAPTARGETWALTGPDIDTPNLTAILAGVRARWSVDPERMLLTGMSDGGTFAYVSGLEPGSPFTHLAPVSAAFHPMLAQMADRERIGGLPIHIVHGALDWMFPVDMAREAARSLEAAGAAVTYREIADLSHTYPREANPGILAWLGGG